MRYDKRGLLMPWGSIILFIREASANIRRSSVCFITVFAISIALIMMGAFILTSMCTETFLQHMRHEAVVAAYCRHELPVSEVKKLSERLKSCAEVNEITIISPSEAVKNLFKGEDERALLQIGLENNCLPYSLKISTNGRLEALLKVLNAENGVECVYYDENFFKQLNGMAWLNRVLSLITGLLMGAASIFTVYNAVRLNFYIRKKDVNAIDVSSCRGRLLFAPFVAEGMLNGLIAAAMSVLILYSIYYLIVKNALSLTPFFLACINRQAMALLAAKLFIMGSLLGVCVNLLFIRSIKLGFQKGD